MLALTPPGEELELHVNLLRHGAAHLPRRCPAGALPRAVCAAARAMLPEPPDLLRAVPPDHRSAAEPRGSTAKAITA